MPVSAIIRDLFFQPLRPASRLALPLVALALVAACANPVPPGGGPRDTTPPSIRQSTPAAGAVNVPTDTRIVRLTFTEYVNRGSLVQALSLTPAFERRLEFDWDGRTVEMELPDALRDNTTYIVTIDTDLNDSHGVSLNEPVTLAFSTGPRINQGQIAGRIVTPPSGAAAPTVDVYAYPLSDSATSAPRPLPDQPAYRTQTGEDGQFAFDHMREQDYFVIGVQDANRNRRPDRQEATAAPPQLRLPADSVVTDVPVPWLLARVDTVAPSPQSVRAPTDRRLRLSFSEPVRLSARTPGSWTVRDSVAGATVNVEAVYQTSDAPTEVALRTAPMAPSPHRVVVPASTVADTLGRTAQRDTLRVMPPDRPDTLRAPFRAFVPDPSTADTTGIPLLPSVAPELRFNSTIDTTQLRDAVAVRDTAGQERALSFATNDGTTYRLALDPPLASGDVVTVTVNTAPLAGPDTTASARFRRVANRQLGGLEGEVVLDTVTVRGDSTARQRPNRLRAAPSPRAGSTHAPFVVELRAADTPFPMNRRSLTVGADSTFVFDGLPDGRFRFRAFLDRNRNNQWDPGRVAPYVPAEPLAWIIEPVDSRPRWTNVLPEPLRIMILNEEGPTQP